MNMIRGEKAKEKEMQFWSSFLGRFDRCFFFLNVGVYD